MVTLLRTCVISSAAMILSLPSPMLPTTFDYYLECERAKQGARTEFEMHLRTANADMVAALTKSTEVIAHNSVVMEQLRERLKG